MSETSLERLRRRFRRDRRRGWIGGVCAGIARTWGTDPAFLRAGLVLAALFTPKVAVGLYAVAWILLEPTDR